MSVMLNPVKGPKGLPLLGVARQLQRHTLLPFLGKTQRDFGDFVPLPVPGMKLFLVSHPDGIKHILHDNRNNYVRTVLYDRIRPVFGNGLITSEGEPWKKNRRIVQPAFHSHRIVEVGKIAAQCTQDLCKALEQKATFSEGFDLIPSLLQLTLEIAVGTLFSTGFTVNQHQEISQSIDVFQSFITESFWGLVQLPLFIPTARNRRLIQARNNLDRVIYQLIQDRRSGISSVVYNDLLSLLMEARDENSQPLPDEQIRDEVMTLLVAGHETTAYALGWAFLLLSQHPAVLEKVRNELATVLGGRIPTTEDLPQLKYVRWVFEESMRLYPPAYFFSRTPLQDDQIAGNKIKKGSLLYLSAWLVHRHPDFWENPHSFDPERFSPERAKGRHRFAYFPFGSGPHACIGAAMATMEAQVILAILLQKFQFISLNPKEITPDPLLTLRIKSELRFKVQEL